MLNSFFLSSNKFNPIESQLVSSCSESTFIEVGLDSITLSCVLTELSGVMDLRHRTLCTWRDKTNERTENAKVNMMLLIDNCTHNCVH